MSSRGARRLVKALFVVFGVIVVFLGGFHYLATKDSPKLWSTTVIEGGLDTRFRLFDISSGNGGLVGVGILQYDGRYPDSDSASYLHGRMRNGHFFLDYKAQVQDAKTGQWREVAIIRSRILGEEISIRWMGANVLFALDLTPYQRYTYREGGGRAILSNGDVVSFDLENLRPSKRGKPEDSTFITTVAPSSEAKP